MRPTPAPRASASVPVRVENRSRCEVRIKVEQASALLKAVRVNAQESESFRLQSHRADGPVTYIVEPEQRCGVKAYVLGRALFSESAVLSIQDDPGLSMFKAGEPPD